MNTPDPRSVPPRITLAAITRFYDDAMRQEGISPWTRERVANRVLWGNPEGFVGVQHEHRHEDREATLEPIPVEPGEEIRLNAVALAGLPPRVVATQWTAPADHGALTRFVSDVSHVLDGLEGDNAKRALDWARAEARRLLGSAEPA